MNTPAYIFDVSKFTARIEQFFDLRQKTRFKLLYSIKALPIPSVLELMRPHVDGFSVSSLFEAKLAREVLGEEGSIHITSPGLRTDEIAEIREVCDYLSLNSLSQRARFFDPMLSKTSFGVRINPQLSFLDDDRYDPCRRFSKLGVPLEEIETLDGMSGLHFHTMFASGNVLPLKLTLEKIESRLGDQLKQLDWINIGGGYVFCDQSVFAEFEEIIRRLSDRYDLTVFFEPGRGIIGEAGELVTEVIDRFESEGKTIVVLDTTVIHHPEIFEYQKPPVIREAVDGEGWSCLLVGCSCKSGDLFGEYQFEQPLMVGSRISLTDVGAYSLVKASRFNGINLPSVYLRDANGRLELIKQYGYEDYTAHWD